MKNELQIVVLVVTFLATLSIGGCGKVQKQLRIDLTTGFSGEFVEIRLGNKLINNDNVTTNQVLGLADIITTDFPIGRTQLSVEINGVVSKDRFRHKEGSYIVVNLDKSSSEAVFEYPDTEFVYD